MRRRAMEVVWCWRCGRDVAMFDDDEWARISPLLHDGMFAIQRHRTEHGVALADAPFRELYSAALREHTILAGHDDVRPQDIWHHRRADHGSPCRGCRKPLRTPLATQCAACGLARDSET